MSEGKRPGGLTALAVLNFVFGAFGLIGTLGMLALMAFLDQAAKSGEGEAADAQREMAKAWQEIGIGVFYVMLIFGAITAVLLIVSGVGYLKQKKFLGRGMGNAYALVSIAAAITTAVMVSQAAGGGFSIGTIVGLVYPVLTLILVNGTFKEDLVR